MTSLISLDVSKIAAHFSEKEMTHIESGVMSPDSRFHAYVFADGDGHVEAPASASDADMVIVLDGAGAYSVFMAEGLHGQELFAHQIAEGHASEFMEDAPDGP